MKKFSYLVIVLSWLNPADAQPDSLKRVLAETTVDAVRLTCLSRLSYNYIYSNVDSAAKYVQQFILLAQQMKSDSALSAAYQAYGEFYSITGNYPQALEQWLKSLQIAERAHSFLMVDKAKLNLSRSYADQGDYKRSIQLARLVMIDYNRHFTPALLPIKLISDTSLFYYFIVSNLAHVYEAADELDSALKYVLLFESISRKLFGGMPSPVAFVYGNIYSKKNDYALAMSYYHEGMAQAMHVPKDYIDNAYGISKVFEKMNWPDSAIYYAERILRVADTARYPLMQMNALKLLANTFKVRGNADSATKYFELATLTQDSIFNRDKSVQMQNLTFNEQLRQEDIREESRKRMYRSQVYSLIAGVVGLGIVSLILYRNNKQKQKAKIQIENAYRQLKNTQTQLIQSEKMASLGELTAGIAHEIENPLNFVNNFSEVNKDLLIEMNNEITKGNYSEASSIAQDIIHNDEKINFHGKRADSIVKSMLQHSRTSSGQKELTDINALTDEYLRIAYHGLRAKDNSSKAKVETDFDYRVREIHVIRQDIGRVILNLINNAFYAVNEKQKQDLNGYEPRVTIVTKRDKGMIGIMVKDNGNGVPQKILDKIFQPFFTTKPTGQGPGLGLSLAYDIVKAHGGEIKVETQEGKGSQFMIQLPAQ